jgi:hypothetical protein
MILPGTGRGTIRRMVEGHPRLLKTPAFRSSAARPFTPTLRVAVPLPRWGRI